MVIHIFGNYGYYFKPICEALKKPIKLDKLSCIKQDLISIL